MAKNVFGIKKNESDSFIYFPHIRVLSLTQTFEILDGENATRALSGEMKRDIIGSYYNYKLTLKPENSAEGMKEYNYLWYLCSSPRDYWYLNIPDDVLTNTSMSGTTHNMKTIKAYITSGSRDMTKFNLNGIDYWGQGEFQFVSMNPARK